MAMICGRKHSVKVWSYCSQQIPTVSWKTTAAPPTLNEVTCIYGVTLSTARQVSIRFRWSNVRGFCLNISGYPFSDSKNSLAVRDLRGTKTFESCSSIVEVFWDLRRARYGSGPEPVDGFYVLVLIDSELSLVLGDKEEQQEIKKLMIYDERGSEFSLISRREVFSGNGCCLYSTRAKFCEAGACHDVSIEFFEDTMVKQPMLCVCIDKKKVIEVRRLHWNFRGNETIFLDGLWVDVVWDVHDWFFRPPTRGNYGVFVFRTRNGFNRRVWLEENEHEHGALELCLMISVCKK